MTHLRHVQQSTLVHKVHKYTVRHDRADDSFIHIAHFGYVRDRFDSFLRCFQSVRIGTGNIDDAFVTDFFNINHCACSGLDVLDYFTTRANDSSDLAFLNDDFQDARCMRFEIRSWRSKDFFHFVKDMQASFARLQQGLSKRS